MKEERFGSCFQRLQTTAAGPYHFGLRGRQYSIVEAQPVANHLHSEPGSKNDARVTQSPLKTNPHGPLLGSNSWKSTHFHRVSPWGCHPEHRDIWRTPVKPQLLHRGFWKNQSLESFLHNDLIKTIANYITQLIFGKKNIFMKWGQNHLFSYRCCKSLN